LVTWRELDRSIPGRELLEEAFEGLPTLLQGEVHQLSPVRVHEHIEDDVDTRPFPAQLCNSGRCRMDSHQQVVEGKIAVNGNHDLAV
jgi:hypothetical protein